MKKLMVKGVEFKVMCFQRQNHKNDVNGNPRRLYVAYATTGDVVGVWEIGYGNQPKELDGVVELSPVDITPAEYHSTKRFAKLREFAYHC